MFSTTTQIPIIIEAMRAAAIGGVGPGCSLIGKVGFIVGCNPPRLWGGIPPSIEGLQPP